LDVTVIFCGKLLGCPVRDANECASREETRTNTELCALSTVKPHGSMAALRSAPRRFRRTGQRNHRRAPGVRRRFGYANRVPAVFSGIRLLKVKDPSGGTTGRVKLYGALGVDGRSRRIQPMGRDNRSHTYCVAAGLPNVQNVRRFFWVPVRGGSPKITAQQGDSRRLRPIYPTPWQAGNHSAPGSQNCYRRLTDQAPAFFLRQLCWTQRQPAPPARRPRP
jgi:hypothetical protein